MKQTKKTPQFNTKKDTKAKVTPEKHDWDDYYCNISFKQLPANATTRENFSIAWVDHMRKNPNIISIWKYPVEVAGMYKSTVEDWMAKDVNVNNAYKYVRSLCAIRRDEGASTRDLDGSWIAKTMPMYCDDYKALEEWRSRLSEKVAAAGGVKVVEIPAFGDADLLPVKKEKK